MNDTGDSSVGAAPAGLPSRQRWMTVLARAERHAMEARLALAPALPDFVWLRAPETGLVMLRGRAGGTGDAFNLGEAPVTRCSIRDEEGRVGHAYCLGRDKQKTALAARLDAVLQEPAVGPAYASAVVEPLAAAQSAAKATRAAKAAATEVSFFTLTAMRS